MTTSALADELSVRIDGGRVQSAGLVDRETVAIEIYAQRSRQHLVVSLGGEEPAAWLATTEIRADPTSQTPFTLLMRKYLRGSMVTAIAQPSLDRVIQISFAKLLDRDVQNSNSAERDDDPACLTDALRNSMLSIEIMGRRSNVVLIDDDGRVLDALKRVSPHMSRVRPIQPGLPYVLPPAGDRLDPRAISAAAIAHALDNAQPNEALATVLVRALAGVSPQMAREISYRATGSAGTAIADVSPDDTERIAESVRHLFSVIESGEWHPTLVRDSDNAVVAYGATRLTHLQEEYQLTGCDSISEAIEAYRGSRRAPARHSSRRARLVTAIGAAQEKARSKVHTLEAEEHALADGDRYRRWGEAIYANVWTIAPGQAELVWEGEAIPLSAGATPAETAQEYFVRYRKSGRGREQLGELVVSAKQELAYLDQLQTLATLADSFDEIEAVRIEWESVAAVASSSAPASNRGARKTKRSPSVKPVRDDSGNSLYIGRSGQQNDFVTFSVAAPSDYWLHARGVPGAHVIVRPEVAGAALEPRQLERAASIAAWYSAARENSHVEVDICRRRDVKKIRGAGPGMVTYRNEQTIRVTPRSPEDA